MFVYELSCRDVQVAHHLVAAPSPEEFDGVGVDASEQEGHGATGAKAAGAHVLSLETVLFAEGINGNSQRFGDVCAFNQFPTPLFFVCAEGGCWGCYSCVEAGDEPLDG